MMAMVLATATLAACGSSDGTGLDWPAHDPAGAGTGLIWADRDTGEVHLSDGSTLAADRPVSTFVIAGAGAYVVDSDDDSLVEVTRDGTRPTGAHVGRGVTASPNGRYLAFIDPLAAPKNEGDARLLTSVVVDLKAGKEVFRSTRGMGDPDKDDLSVLYENADYGVLGLSDDTAWIHPATGDVLTIDLATGDATTVPDDDVDDDGHPWSPPAQLSPPTSGGPASPDRSWGIYHVSRAAPELSTDPAFTLPRDELESADGSRLVPRTGVQSWTFERWLDAETVIGFGTEQFDSVEEFDDIDNRRLLTCTVPDGACTIIPNTSRAILPEPSIS